MYKPTRLLRVAVMAAVGFSAVYPACADTNEWTTTTQTFPLNIVVVNGCTAQSDYVHLVGTGYILTHTSVQNGTMLVREIDLLGGTGSGTPSGAKYVYGEAAKINTSFGPNQDFPFSYMERRTQVLAGIGVPDQVITYNIRLVIDVNGNVTTDIFDAALVCH